MDIEDLFKKKNVNFNFYEIDLFSANDNQLKSISQKMGLALDLEEMKEIGYAMR